MKAYELSQSCIDTIKAMARCGMSVKKAAEALNVAPGTVSSRLLTIRRATGFEPTEFFDLIRLIDQLRNRPEQKKAQTLPEYKAATRRQSAQGNPSLCWECENATNFKVCCWAKSFKPVEGWDADESIISGNGAHTRSYHVKECPLFEPDKVYVVQKKPEYRAYRKSRRHSKT